MHHQQTLTDLLNDIQDTLQARFEGEAFWIHATAMNVKRQPTSRRCYLTLEDYEGSTKTAEAKAVFWANSYSEIESFEKATGQKFKDGIQIICKVRIRYHKVYGLNLDVIGIDFAHTLGVLELERQRTLDRLLKENPTTVQLFDGVYRTYNNRLPLPLLIQNIALITAPNSDGQRDFLQELTLNRHGYSYNVTEFLTTIQGDSAHLLILEQLNKIKQSGQAFDVVAIVRGGGSQTDFKCFDEYELCNAVANFAIPVFTGIGHDRNQSIVDLMAREQKTPTKVAAMLVEHNFEFENRLIDLKLRIADAVQTSLQNAKDNLRNAKRIIKLASPQAILDRGFAMLMVDGKIVTDPKLISENTKIQTVLRDEVIYSTVTEKKKNGKRTKL